MLLDHFLRYINWKSNLKLIGMLWMAKQFPTDYLQMESWYTGKLSDIIW
jgi:hypothetical protein